MAVQDRLKHVTSKIQRAQKHVADVEREVRAFLDTDPYKVATQRDSQTRKLVYYLASVKPTPDCLPLLAGDAIQNLMSTLDHLAYQIVCSDTADRPPNPSGIYFPVADDAAKYEARKRGKMQGVSNQTFKAIDALKPYKGGNDLLWVLYRLNNVEKHRLLITVGSMFQSLNLGAHMSVGMQRDFPERVIPIVDAFFKPADVLFPLKEGDELFIDAPDAEVNEKLQFRFNVALYEPHIIEAQSLLETLHHLMALVEGVVTGLAARLT